MADKKISQLQNLLRTNYTKNDLLLINHGLAPYSAQTTSNTKVFDFVKYFSGTSNFITGLTFNSGTLVINFNGTLQSIPVTGFTSTYLTGGTYSVASSATTFTNNTGGTFTVTGMTFEKKPAGTLNSIQYNNNYKFSGNTLIYNSGTTSVYNKGYNGVVSNTFYGEDAGGNTNSGFQTVFGAFSFFSVSSSGGYNDLFGGYTLSAATTAYGNSFFGYGRGRSSTTANLSVGFGSNPIEASVTGLENVMVGYNNLIDRGSRDETRRSVGIGAYSQGSISTNSGIGNLTSIGYSSLWNYYTQGGTVAVGSNSMYYGHNVSGPDYSVAVGVNSYKYGTYITTDVVAVGSNTLSTDAGQKYDAVIVGNNLLADGSYTWNSFPTMLGEGKGSYTTSGARLPSVSIGYNLYPSGSTVPGSTSNFHVIGYNVGSGFRSTSFIGNNILTKWQGQSNAFAVFLGSNIMPQSYNSSSSSDSRAVGIVLGSNIFNNRNDNKDLTVGNIFLGNFIGYTATTATDPDYNIVMGYSAGYSLNTSYNSIIGAYSHYSLSSGVYNTSVGIETEYYSDNSYSTSIGYRAGYSLTGSSNNQNTFIGAYAGSNLKGGSNNTIIGYSAQASTTIVSNEITLGNSSISSLRSNVTSITSLSDIRDKNNISSIENGLNIINELNPVIFKWNMRDKTKVDIKSSGFIAQEVLTVEEKHNLSENFKLVYKTNPDKLEISSWNLLPIMVKSLQDLSNKNKELKERIKNLTI